MSGPAPVLARVHSSCVTSETFGACDCDCAQQLDGALARIAKVGRGVVFYLLQEGRGAGFEQHFAQTGIEGAEGDALEAGAAGGVLDEAADMVFAHHPRLDDLDAGEGEARLGMS